MKEGKKKDLLLAQTTQDASFGLVVLLSMNAVVDCDRWSQSTIIINIIDL